MTGNKKHKKTAIIIVTYKALEHIKICIQSIRERTSFPYELIIIDNNSGSEVVNYLNSLKDITLITNNNNRLLTPAQNQGLQKISTDAEFVLFLNPDILVLREDWLQLMIDRLETKPNLGITGPICNYHPLAPLMGNIDMSCLLVRRNVLQETGGLDENYPWNGAGVVLTAAAWSKGWRYSHIKKPKIIKHFKQQSRVFNYIPNKKIDLRKIFNQYKLIPRWSAMGLSRQIINRPDTIWTAIKTKF